jgi:hypothetical protein
MTNAVIILFSTVFTVIMMVMLQGKEFGAGLGAGLLCNSTLILWAIVEWFDKTFTSR